jgi:hypothetical protein
MEIDDDETTTGRWKYGRTSEHDESLVLSSSTSAPQSLSKLKRKAPSSPSDTASEGFITRNEAIESLNPHDCVKSLQLPSVTIPLRTGFRGSVEGLLSESPLPESEFEKALGKCANPSYR